MAVKKAATKKAAKKPAKKTKPSASSHIVMILDRSGSMYAIRDDTIGGFNAFLADQKELKAPGAISLFQFDDVYEQVYQNMAIADAKPLTTATFVPRGSTALLDAIGRTLNTVTGENIVVVVITDGKENASREFRLDQIKALIAEREKAGWNFVYLGANQDAFEVGGAMGFGVANTLSTSATAAGTQSMYSSLAANVGKYRGAVAAGKVEVAKTALKWSAADRKKQEEAGASKKT